MPSKYEKKACQELIAAGWTVDVKWGMHRYSKWNDFFHLFDILALKPGKGFRLISIKGRAGIPSQHKEKVGKFKVPSCCSKEIWKRSKSKKKYWYKIKLE